MTRSHKANDRNHAALADGTALPEEHIPKYFAKHGFIDADPKKTKKNGGGKGNWGGPGEEVVDEDFNFTNSRRRSNSSGVTNDVAKFKSKFDVNEPEPVFEEGVHGPLEDDEDDAHKADGAASENSSADDKSTQST